MREYLLRNTNNFAGIHYIYENQDECLANNPGIKKIWRWSIDDVDKMKINDWVQAEDGYVVQILYIRLLTNKDGFNTKFVRFPMGSFACYRKKDGNIRYPRFYAQYTNAQKNAASARTNKPKLFEKTMFVKGLLAGMDSIEAFKLAFHPKEFLTIHQIKRKVMNLMEDEEVQKQFQEALEDFKGNIEKTFGNERLLQEINDLLDKSDKGSAAHRGNIKFVMELRGMIKTTTPTKALPAYAGVAETPYEEEDAPILSKKTT